MKMDVAVMAIDTIIAGSSIVSGGSVKGVGARPRSADSYWSVS